MRKQALFLRRRMMGLLVLSAISLASGCAPKPAAPSVLTFIGHDAFLVGAESGPSVLCDPYDVDYVTTAILPLPDGVTADLVTVSHAHRDHTNAASVAGAPRVARAAGRLRLGDMTVNLLEGREGKPSGISAIPNLVCVIEREGVKIVHLGDSGVVDEPRLLAAIKDADVVIVNIDDYVMPMERIAPFMDSIGARTVVPAHWEGPDQLERFLRDWRGDFAVNRTGSRLPLHGNMPRQILVMKELAAKD